MDFTNDFFIQAQGIIERELRSLRNELLKASGNIAFEKKADKTPVTELDRKVETVLRKALREFDSGIGLEGEELGIEGSRQTFWLIDPIDGTSDFTRGGRVFRNIVTLIHEKRPYFTVIYKPVTDELFVAAEGEGAFWNGQPIKMVQRPLKDVRLEVHSPGVNPKTWALMETLAQHINGIRVTGDFTQVATGQLDGFLVYKGKGGPWDFAPRALLLQEAGAKVTNLGINSYDYTTNDMLAAHPSVFDTLMKIIIKKDEELT